MESVVFCGNDYLGLAREPRVAEAMARAVHAHGVSATSGRFFLGWTAEHEALEYELAAHFEAGAACLLASAYLGGLTFFTAFGERYRMAYCDANTHANLMAGMRAAGVAIRIYRHQDAEDLRRQLRRHQGPPPIVVTDTIFGISGEVAPLPTIVEATRTASALLLLDDAHGVFALGKTGRGMAEVAAVDVDACVVLGSMSKALGCHGGFFVGPADLIQPLQRASAGASPAAVPVVAACREALRIVQEEPERRERLHRNIARLAGIFRAEDLSIVADTTPILALLLADEGEAQALAEYLESRGIVVRYARYPSEPRHNLLRTAARTLHSNDDLERFAAAIREWRAPKAPAW